MANDFNQNNNKQDEFRTTFYSPVRLRNPESDLDPSELSFRFWKGLLGIVISPKLKKSNTEFNQYDNDNCISVYINYTKARMLYEEMAILRQNPDLYNSIGISSGPSGLISVCNGKEVGTPGPVLILRKLDQNGTVSSSYMYEFNREFHYSIRNFNEDTLNYDKNYFEWVEYDEFMTILKTFYENAAQIVAFGVIDSSRKEYNRLHMKINSIMDNLGIEKGKGNSSSGSSRSFFDMANQNNKAFSNNVAEGVPTITPKSTLEALEEEM